MNVEIITKSLPKSLHNGRFPNQSLDLVKTLHVDLSGKSGQSWIDCKIHLNAKDLKKGNGMDVITTRERCNLFREDNVNVLLFINEYPDNIDSFGLTEGVIDAIFVVFKCMHRCERIIINCNKGMNRSPMVGARLAALISEGKNEPCELAYGYFLQLCGSLNRHFDRNNITTWPNLCTNDWTQMAICEFKRQEGRKYHSRGGGGDGF